MLRGERNALRASGFVVIGHPSAVHYGGDQWPEKVRREREAARHGE